MAYQVILTRLHFSGSTRFVYTVARAYIKQHNKFITRSSAERYTENIFFRHTREEPAKSHRTRCETKLSSAGDPNAWKKKPATRKKRREKTYFWKRAYQKRRIFIYAPFSDQYGEAPLSVAAHPRLGPCRRYRFTWKINFFYRRIFFFGIFRSLRSFRI